MFPLMGMKMILPAMLHDSVRFKRDHNRWVKESLREELEYHHKNRIPGHFRQKARHKYDHYKRKDKYLAIKASRYRSLRDLVKGDANKSTEATFTQGYKSLRVGGKATNGEVRGTLTYQFPFPTTDRKLPGVNVDVIKMAEEISSFTGEEYGEVFRGFATRYLKKMDKGLKQNIRVEILAKHPTVFQGIG